MSDHLNHILSQCKARGLILDTNVLLLYLVGAYNKHRITTFKRTKDYRPEDFDTLLAIIQRFDKLVTTPNILTEVSNLAGQFGEPLRTAVFASIANVVPKLFTDEGYVASSSIVGVAEFLRLGLTDVGIGLLAHDRHDRHPAVLTDDFDLYSYLSRLGVAVLNFSHYRYAGLIGELR